MTSILRACLGFLVFAVVSVPDGVSAQTTTTVTVGPNPSASAVNTATNKIYVANQGGTTVSIIDGATDAVSMTLRVGDAPHTFPTGMKAP